MSNKGRALAESFFLHGLLVAVMVAMADFLPPPPKTIRLDLTFFELPAEPTPKAVEATPSPLPPPPHAVEKPTPEPLPVSKETTKAPPPKKLQPKERKTIPRVAAAEPEPLPVPQSAGRDSATSVETPQPVTATPAESAPTNNPVEEYRQANFKAIRNSILANLDYPMLARRQGWSGKVNVSFLIAPDGSISELRLLASSGFPVLDEQALDAVRSAAPFTPPRIATLLVMPVTFQLN